MPKKSAKTSELKNSGLRIAILGGSFDPIHAGHYQIVQAVLKTKLVDQVWLMPCRSHPWGKNLTDIDHRLSMCELATASTPNVVVSDYEVAHLGYRSSHTYELITALLDDPKYEGIQWFYIIGEDNAQRFKEWYEYKKLLTLVPFIVIHRAGAAQTINPWYKVPPHQFIPNTEVMTVSSTEIRNMLKKHGKVLAKQKLLGKIDRRVLDYAVKNGLY